MSEIERGKEMLRKRNAELQERLEELESELAAKEDLLRREMAERKAAQEKLCAQEEMYSSIFTHIGIGIAVISPQMEILFLNTVMKKINPQIDVGARPICYESFNTPPRHEICSYCPTIQTFRDGQVHIAVTDTPIQGTIHHFRITSAPVPSEDGSVSAVIEVVEEITERRQAEDALRESEQRYRGLVELAPAAIYVHTRGRLIFANTEGARLLGAKRPEELYGREALDFVHPNSREFVKERIRSAFASGEPNLPAEEIFVRLDGSVVPVEVASVPFKYGGEDALQIIARDITERKRMQEEMIKTQKLESLGVLAGGIAHDFNNILTGVIGNLSLAKLRLDPSSDILKSLELCEKAARHAGELTRQLLTFARGGEPLKKQMAVAPLIEDTVSFALRGSNVRSDVQMDADLWCLEADESQISQVLNNLLLNAVQAMSSGGEVTVRAANERLGAANPYNLPAGEYLRISVQDRGCGIAESDLLKIFDPYFTTKPQGSGLGLASVYSIVKRHGGAVEVSSVLGGGSCFAVHLPAVPWQGGAYTGAKEPAALKGSGRILVMDDEDFIREVASEILQFIGYRVDVCAEGSKAVELFCGAKEDNDPYCAVILDLTVPGGMGGKDAAARILEIDPGAVLIVSSGYSNDPVVANFRQHGFSGVISKPFGAKGIAQELQRLV